MEKDMARWPRSINDHMALAHTTNSHVVSYLSFQYLDLRTFHQKCGASAMSGMDDVKQVDGDMPMDTENSMPSTQKEEEVVKNKYGGIVPKKPPLISKDHERAYFDSADWALGKQGVEKPKGPLEALRPKLQPTQQQTRYRKSPCGPSEGEDGNNTPSAEDSTAEE